MDSILFHPMQNKAHRLSAVSMPHMLPSHSSSTSTLGYLIGLSQHHSAYRLVVLAYLIIAPKHKDKDEKELCGISQKK